MHWWEYFVDVDVEKLNDIIRSNRHIQVNEDDYNDKINIEDNDGDEGKSIDQEEYNSY